MLPMNKVLKVGGSLGITIPTEILAALDIKRGDYISFGVFQDKCFVVRVLTDDERLILKPKVIQNDYTTL